MTGNHDPEQVIRTPAIDHRIAARRAEVRSGDRRRRLRRTLTILTLVIIAVGAFVVDRSGIVGLDSVEVRGVERLEASQVIAAAALAEGASVRSLPLEEARERVEALPWVEEAVITRLDPVSLEIAITERVPIMRTEGPSGSLLVDESGRVLGEVCADCGDGQLPVVRLDVRAPAPGRDVDSVPTLANALTVMRSMPGPLRAEVVELVALGTIDELNLLRADGIVVRIGRADRLEEKWRSLGAVLEDLGGERVRQIDVRAPLAPVVRR